jgi:hypothetical protein
MARGKEAVQATNRRLEAAMEHIDRLTSQLADYKVRMRAAEERAARFEGTDQMNKAMELRNDELLAAAVDKLRWWQKVAKEDHRRRQAAWNEIGARLLLDLIITGTHEDQVEIFCRRYPAIDSALCAGNNPSPVLRGSLSPRNRRLSEDQTIRLKRALRLRSQVPTAEGVRDVVDIWGDLLDARQMDLSPEETRELVLGGGLVGHGPPDSENFLFQPIEDQQTSKRRSPAT